MIAAEEASNRKFANLPISSLHGSDDLLETADNSHDHNIVMQMQETSLAPSNHDVYEQIQSNDEHHNYHHQYQQLPVPNQQLMHQEHLEYYPQQQYNINFQNPSFHHQNK